MIIAIGRRTGVSAVRSLRDLDWPLLVTALIIALMGGLQIYSATHGTKLESAWWRHMVNVAVGIALMLIFSRINYHTLLGQVPYLYGISIFMLLVTLFFGKKILGARRWLVVFGQSVQVSEFVKIVVILLVAWYLVELRTKRLEVKDLLKLTGLVLIPFLLVRKQPDMGTALTFLPALAAGVLLVGLRWQYVVAVAGVILALLAVFWFFDADGYQKDRILTFLDPGRDPQGKGYQVLQSRIAVGNGGVWGQGVTRGTQTQLRFLPIAPTDFIFSTFAEEHGFVGVIIALGLYYLLLVQIVQNGQTAPDRAGTIICIGVSATLLFHLLVNVGMVINRMPVVGIPLPLMSYGGTSTLAVFVMLGLVMNVRSQRLFS